MQTTDGFLGNRPKIKKPRRVAVIDQRKDDGVSLLLEYLRKKANVQTTHTLMFKN